VHDPIDSNPEFDPVAWLTEKPANQPLETIPEAPGTTLAATETQVAIAVGGSVPAALAIDISDATPVTQATGLPAGTTLANVRKDYPKAEGLRFTPYAWSKLLYLLHRGDTEVGGFGISAENDVMLVRDFVLVPQECTSCTVDFDESGVGDFMLDCLDKGIPPALSTRIFIHTHPDMSPRPSGVDEHTFRTAFGKCDWAVMFIIARRHETFCRLKFNVGPGHVMEVPVSVDWGAVLGETLAPVTSPATLAVSEHVAAWDAEYTRCVRRSQMGFHTRTWQQPYQQNGHYHPNPQIAHQNERSWLDRHSAIATTSSRVDDNAWEQAAWKGLAHMDFQALINTDAALADEVLHDLIADRYADPADPAQAEDLAAVRERYKALWDTLGVEVRYIYVKDAKAKQAKPKSTNFRRADDGYEDAEWALMLEQEEHECEQELALDRWFFRMALLQFWEFYRESPALAELSLAELAAAREAGYKDCDETRELVITSVEENQKAEWFVELVTLYNSLPSTRTAEIIRSAYEYYLPDADCEEICRELSDELAAKAAPLEIEGEDSVEGPYLEMTPAQMKDASSASYSRALRLYPRLTTQATILLRARHAVAGQTEQDIRDLWDTLTEDQQRTLLREAEETLQQPTGAQPRGEAEVIASMSQLRWVELLAGYAATAATISGELQLTPPIWDQMDPEQRGRVLRSAACLRQAQQASAAATVAVGEPAPTEEALRKIANLSWTTLENNYSELAKNLASELEITARDWNSLSVDSCLRALHNLQYLQGHAAQENGKQENATLPEQPPTV